MNVFILFLFFRSKTEKIIELEPATKNEAKNKSPPDRVDKPLLKEKTESSKKKDDLELLNTIASTPTQFYSILDIRDNLIRSSKSLFYHI